MCAVPWLTFNTWQTHRVTTQFSTIIQIHIMARTHHNMSCTTACTMVHNTHFMLVFCQRIFTMGSNTISSDRYPLKYLLNPPEIQYDPKGKTLLGVLGPIVFNHISISCSIWCKTKVPSISIPSLLSLIYECHWTRLSHLC